MADKNRVQLSHFPGGKETFKLVADYCYNINIGLDASNVAQLRCAAEFLQMTSPRNLASDTNSVLFEILRSPRRSFGNIAEISMSCCRLGVIAEQAGVVGWCISAITEVWMNDELPEVLLEQFLLWPPEWFGKLVITARDSAVPLKRVTVAVKGYIWSFLLEHRKQVDMMLSGETKSARVIDDGRPQLDENADSSVEAGTTQSAKFKLSRVLSNCSDTDESDTSFSREIRTDHIRNVIDLLILELPASAPFEDVVDSEWACLVLRINAYLHCKCYQRLIRVAAELVESLTALHLRELSPDLLVDIVQFCCSEGSTQPDTVCSVIDEYLWEQAKSQKLDPTTLLRVARAIPYDFPQSHDGLLLVVEKLLSDKGAEFADEVISQLLEVVDIHRLSETTLKVAAERRVLPLEYIVNSSIALCNRLRSELENTQAVLRLKEAEIQDLYSAASVCEGAWQAQQGQEFLNIHPCKGSGVCLQLSPVICNSPTQVIIRETNQSTARQATCSMIQWSADVDSLFLFNPFKNQLIEIQTSLDALTQKEVVKVSRCYKKVERSGPYWPFSPLG